MDQVVKASASVHISYTLNKLEECRLQGVPKFAVNANVSGSWECLWLMGMLMGTFAGLQLTDRKNYLEGFPPVEITTVGTTFAKHLSLQIIIFSFTLSTKSGVGVYEHRGSS